MNAQHITLIHRLFATAETINLPLWLSGGCAIDGKLDRITPEIEMWMWHFRSSRERNLFRYSVLLATVRLRKQISKLSDD